MALSWNHIQKPEDFCTKYTANISEEIYQVMDNRESKELTFLADERRNKEEFKVSSDDFNSHKLEDNRTKTDFIKVPESIKNLKKEDAQKGELLSLVKSIFEEASIPEKFEEWNYEDQKEWIIKKGSKELLALPDSLLRVIPSMVCSGDCGRISTKRPDWLDMEKFRRGQRFAMENFFGLSFSNVLGLELIFMHPDGLKTLILTRKSDTPYLAFKRYLSTICRIRNWYTEDPWKEGTSAYADIQTVRRMHLAVRQHLNNCEIEEIDEASKISNPWCPMRSIIIQDFKLACPSERVSTFNLLQRSKSRPKGLNQAEMGFTQFAFIGLMLLYPKAFGAHYATEDDLEGFCHLWRGIGYLLGMEDEYNFCNGDLKEVTQRMRDLVEFYVKPGLNDIKPEWEHMTRCVVEGNNYILPGGNFTTSLLYVTELIGIRMPNLYSKISFSTWLAYMFNKFFFFYLMRLPRVLKHMNGLVNKAIDKALDYSPEKHLEFKARSDSQLQNF